MMRLVCHSMAWVFGEAERFTTSKCVLIYLYALTLNRKAPSGFSAYGI